MGIHGETTQKPERGKPRENHGKTTGKPRKNHGNSAKPPSLCQFSRFFAGLFVKVLSLVFVWVFSGFLRFSCGSRTTGKPKQNPEITTRKQKEKDGETKRNQGKPGKRKTTSPPFFSLSCAGSFAFFKPAHTRSLSGPWIGHGKISFTSPPPGPCRDDYGGTCMVMT